VEVTFTYATHGIALDDTGLVEVAAVDLTRKVSELLRGYRPPIIGVSDACTLHPDHEAKDGE
jgi:LmbE family N-acetylglucosaminyl deacetylase